MLRVVHERTIAHEAMTINLTSLHLRPNGIGTEAAANPIEMPPEVQGQNATEPTGESKTPGQRSDDAVEMQKQLQRQRF